MEYLKKLSKSLLYVLIPTLLMMFIITLLNYIGIMSYKILSIFKYIILFIFILIGSYRFGFKNKNKGLFEGIKFGLIIILIFILLNLLFKGSFSIKSIIYYGIILVTSIFGGILGKNKRP